jgi:hypothetical protein
MAWVCRAGDDGDWLVSPITKPHEFIITITAAEKDININTDLYEIIIDISPLDISAGYKVAIVERHKQ